MRYSFLEAKITERGIKKAAISAAIGVTPKSFNNKLTGKSPFILSDAEAVSKTATEINSSAGDYSLSIIEFQHLYYDALQAALRLGDQIGQAYHLCDATGWDPDELTVTWGNGVLYDADQEWAERKEMVEMGLLKPELALAWKFDLPCGTESDLAEIRKNYMPELSELES